MDWDEGDRVKGCYVDRSLKSLEVQTTPTASTTRRKNPGCWSLAMHAKVNRDCGFDFYRLPIQKKWLVAPLLDRLDRGGRQQRVPTNHLQVLNVPAFVNKRRHYYNSLNARLLCQGRVSGLDPGDEQALAHTLGNAHPLYRGGRPSQPGDSCEACTGT